MLLFLLETASQQCADEVFAYLQYAFGINAFRRLFPVILTDNGSGFKNVYAMEKSRYGSPCTSVFYSDRMASWQKPHIERSHEYIRQVLPKGKFFDKLTQVDVTLLANHINSIFYINKQDIAFTFAFDPFFITVNTSVIVKYGLNRRHSS